MTTKTIYKVDGVQIGEFDTAEKTRAYRKQIADSQKCPLVLDAKIIKVTRTRKSKCGAAMPADWQPKRRALMVRTNDANNRASHNGFQYPDVGGIAEAPDWAPTPRCGHGLHGLLWGEGDAAHYEQADSAKWLVCEVDLDETIDLNDKVKVRRCRVLFCGDRTGAIAMVQADPGSIGKKVNFGVSKAGHNSTVTGGYRSTVTGGHNSTVTGGHNSTVTGGYRSTVTGGDNSTISIRYYDPKRGKYRVAIAEVGENGIEPDTAYILDGEHRFVAKNQKPVAT
jgi:hypothetical protein